MSNGYRYRVRVAEPKDIPAIIAYQVAMAKETENLDLDLSLVEKGVRTPFERSNVAEYIVVEACSDSDPSEVVAVPSWSGRSPPSSWFQKDLDAATLDSTGAECETGAQPFTICSMLMITFEWSDWRGGAIHWIQSVYTHPLHRRRGLFRMLFGFVKARVESDPDAVAIRLYVEHDNVIGMKTYESLGLEVESGYRMMKWSKHAY